MSTDLFRGLANDRGAGAPASDFRECAHHPEPNIATLGPRHCHSVAVLVKERAGPDQAPFKPGHFNAPRHLARHKRPEMQRTRRLVDVNDAHVGRGLVGPQHAVPQLPGADRRNPTHHHLLLVCRTLAHDLKAFSQSRRSRLVGRPTPLGRSCWASRIISNFSFSSGAVTSRM